MTRCRRRKTGGYQEWHFSKKCLGWPTNDWEKGKEFDEIGTDPKPGRICEACKRHEKWK